MSQVERYIQARSQYRRIVDAAQACLEEATDTSLGSRREQRATLLFTKIVCHSISLDRLVPSLEPDTTELWDIASACAVARALIETHDAAAYISFNDITEQMREFRLLAWDLHDLHRRLKILSFLNSTDPGRDKLQDEERRKRSDVVKHACFGELSAPQRQRIESGDAPDYLVNRRDRNRENSVNHRFYSTVYLFLSQHVHSYPMAQSQLRSFTAGGTVERGQFENLTRYSEYFVCRAIERMKLLFDLSLNSVSSHLQLEMKNSSDELRTGFSENG